MSTPLESDLILKALPVITRQKRVLVAASGLATAITTTTYAVKDAVGTIHSYANAARSSAGTGVVEAVTITDRGQQRAGLDLVLFSATVAGVTDNAIFDPDDTNDLPNIVGVLNLPSLAGWRDFSDNSVASYIVPGGLPYICAATTLFGVLVVREAPLPTYASTSDLAVTLTLRLD